MRTEKTNAGGKFEDRVTLMLTRAMNNIGDEYLDELSNFDDMARQDREARLKIITENSRNSYDRWQAGL